MGKQNMLVLEPIRGYPYLVLNQSADNNLVKFIFLTKNKQCERAVSKAEPVIRKMYALSYKTVQTIPLSI